MLTRQAELKTLTRKYAADIDGVLEWAESARDRLARIDVSADALAELSERVEKTAAATRESAVKLTAARTKAAVKLAKAVSNELAGLAMGRAALEVSVRARRRTGGFRPAAGRRPELHAECPASTRWSSGSRRTAGRSRYRSARARPAASCPG
ncbi:hypothetical protein GS872_25625 [Rhodococcus hoagii]|nr:hypothetical protein [Prescottella equi]